MNYKFSQGLVAFACIICCCRPALADSQDCRDSLENQSPLIRHITVKTGQIFDTANPREDNWLFRAANKLHVNTRESTIRRDLLFSENQPYSERLVRESERRLRSRKYLNNVQIETVPNCDGTVDINVKSREVWTFKPTVSFSRSGSNNNTSYGLEDTNFMGTGKSLSLSRSSDADRNYTLFEYNDPNTGILNSSLSVNYSDNSDGFKHLIDWKKPFESLESRWSAGIILNRYEELNFLYDAGDEIDRYSRASREFEVFYGIRVRLDDSSVHRLSFGSTSRDHGYILDAKTLDASRMPIANEYFYPWLEYQFLEEDYIQTSNFQQINRIEDVNLGWNFTLRLGYTSSEIESLNGLYVVKTLVTKAKPLTDKTTVVLKAEAEGFYGDEGWQNFIMKHSFAFHWQNIDSGQFYFNYMEGKTLHPLNNGYLMIGGEEGEGLRGFPAHYKTGDHSRLFNIEQRFYGHQEILSLFYLGGAVFFDAGHVWGESPVSQTQDQWLKDVGFGLRLSNTRLGARNDGGHNVIHIDVAFPIDADDDIDTAQFLVTVKSSF